MFQVHHTFATAGSDGAFNFWDKDSKQRLKVSMSSFSFVECLSHRNTVVKSVKQLLMGFNSEVVHPFKLLNLPL